jgi:hypothetical protein
VKGTVCPRVGCPAGKVSVAVPYGFAEVDFPPYAGGFDGTKRKAMTVNSSDEGIDAPTVCGFGMRIMQRSPRYPYLSSVTAKAGSLASLVEYAVAENLP